MSGEIIGSIIALLADVSSDRGRYISHSGPRHCGADTDLQCSFGYFHQAGSFTADGTDPVSPGCIAIITVFDYTDIDADDVTLFEDYFLGGDAVHDDTVWRCAQSAGKRFEPRNLISLECGSAAVITNKAFRIGVQLPGGYTRFHNVIQRIEQLADYPAGSSDLNDFGR